MSMEVESKDSYRCIIQGEFVGLTDVMTCDVTKLSDFFMQLKNTSLLQSRYSNLNIFWVRSFLLKHNEAFTFNN